MCGDGGLEVVRGLGGQGCFAGVRLGDAFHHSRARRGNWLGRSHTPLSLSEVSLITGAPGSPLPGELEGKSGMCGPYH
jgi:hypothetical protein